MDTTRRALLGVSAMAVPAMLLAGCQNGAQVVTVTQKVVDDLTLVANGLTAALPSLQNVTGVDTAKVGAAVTEAKAIIAAAGTVVVGMTEAAAQPIVTQMSNDYALIMQQIAGFSLPANVTTWLNAVGVLLPVVEVAVGLVLNAAASAGAAKMSPDEARAALRGA